MELDKIRSLAQIMQEYGLSDLELWEDKDKISLSKNGGVKNIAVDFTPENADTNKQQSEILQNKSVSINENTLTAPLVGCVYLSPAPGEDAFVKEGNPVKKGQVLCIIEAMKVMNEFVAPKDGVISKIYINNEEMVEYGQALFCLE